MADDKYLFLLRWTGSLPDNKIAIAAAIPKFLMGIIRGDSLDVPFVNFIPVQSVNHTIGGIGEEKSYSELHEASSWKDTYYSRGLSAEAEESEFKAAAGFRQTKAGPTLDYRRRVQDASNDWQWTGEKPMTEPGALAGNLPEQKHFKFKKRLDSATPQLAYGCSIQEQFKVALFYFRRKVGFNVAAIPFPYLVIGLENVVIRNHEIGGDSEELTLSYDRICRGGISQFADTPVPQGISTRIFDRTTGSGGMVDSSTLALFTAGLTVAMYGAAWTAVGLSSGQGVQ